MIPKPCKKNMVISIQHSLIDLHHFRITVFSSEHVSWSSCLLCLKMYHIATLSHANDECTQHLGTCLLGVLVHHFSYFGLGKESAQMVVKIVSTVGRLDGGEIRELWSTSVAFHHRRSHCVHGRTLLIGGWMAA